jgi:hypothetical protein
VLAALVCGEAAAQFLPSQPVSQPPIGQQPTSALPPGVLPSGQLQFGQAQSAPPRLGQPLSGPPVAGQAPYDPPLFVQPAGSEPLPEEPQQTEPASPAGPGVMFRAEHIEGDGVPQVDSITPLQLFPYVMIDNSLWFSDLRVYSTNDLLIGGNAGLGYRYYSPMLDRVFGISGWYDADNTRELYFEQVGLSLETYSYLLDLRANFYLPVGEKEQQESLEFVNGSTRFSGDRLLYDMVRSTYFSMKGADYELGVPIPTEFGKQHGLRIYGGGYVYQDEEENEIHGWSGRAQINVFAGLDAHVQVTHDDYFETRVFGGVAWTWGRLHRSQLNQETTLGRIGEHVTRNYTVLAPLRVEYEQVQAANPLTGNPYRFAHVSSAASAGGSGAATSPFQTLSEAQTSSPDIIYVHAGSALAGGSTLALLPGQRLLGDSDLAQHFVAVRDFGALLVPHGSTSGARPTVSGSLGDAVVLAHQTEVSNFAITGAGGSGILANGIQNAMIHNVAIDGAAQDGLRLLDTSGFVSISDLTATNTGGAGIALHGGTATFDLAGTTTLAGNAGPSLSIKNLTSGGAVDFDNLTISHRLGRGIEVDNVAGAVRVGGLAIVANEANSAASAVDIRNSSGQFGINRLDVTGATGAAGVNLENNTGVTEFGTLNIASQNATAFRAHSAGTVIVNKAVNDVVDLARGGAVQATNGTALDIENTKLDLNLTSVSSSNATRGISLVNTTGQLVILGDGETHGTAGTITGADTGVFLQNAGLTAMQFIKLDANDVGIYSENSAELVLLGANVSNSTSYGIDSLNTTKMRIGTSDFVGNGAADIRGQFSRVDTYTYHLLTNSFDSTTADNVVLAVVAGGVGSGMTLTADGSTFKNSLAGATGLNVDWNGNLTANVLNSTFLSGGASATGLKIVNAAPGGASTINFTGSGFYGVGANSTAVRVATAGTSNISLTSNTLELRALEGTGYHLSLGASSDVTITNNYIYDIADGSTGILFDSVAGPAKAKIETNLIHWMNPGPQESRGIVFENVAGSLALSGAVDNVVNNAETPFSMPAGVSTGSILVNGVAVP